MVLTNQWMDSASNNTNTITKSPRELKMNELHVKNLFYST